MLTNEELVTRIRAGETALYEQLYQQNKGIIYRACRKYGNPADYEDLLQECFFALHDAVRLFDEGHSKFISYLWFWLKMHIVRYQQDYGYTIRVPAGQHEALRKYRVVLTRYREAFGRDPEPAELAAALGIGPEDLERLQGAAAALGVQSLNVPAAGGDADGNPSELQDLLPDSQNNVDDYIRNMEAEETASELWATVDTIGARRADCIRMRYKNNLSLEAIGDAVGISKQGVAQRIASGLRELRKPQNMKRLLPFLDDYAFSRGTKGIGVQSFYHTGYSATEKAAIKLLELEESIEGFTELRDPE